MHRVAFVILVAAFAAGCTSASAGTSNFDLKPDRIGWYTGETARFMLNLTPSVTKQAPTYLIDRHFAIEEIRFDERGASFGGDYETRNPDDVHLVLVQNGTGGEEFQLTRDTPGVDIFVRIPEKLRDSEYVLELKLFNAGWVRSEPFRVDERTSSS